jgi:ABC-type spermidine/putrescine transport system permease subunit II
MKFNKNNKCIKYKSEAGSVLSEYAIAAAILIPTVIFAAALFFQFNSSGEHQGAIVTRGKGSVIPALEMSPIRVNGGHCTTNPEPCM